MLFWQWSPLRVHYLYSSSWWICICANQLRGSADSTSLYSSKHFLDALLMELYTYTATSIIIQKWVWLYGMTTKIKLFSLWLSHTDDDQTDFKILPIYGPAIYSNTKLASYFEALLLYHLCNYCTNSTTNSHVIWTIYISLVQIGSLYT